MNSHDAPQSRRTSASIQLPKRAHTFQNDGTAQQPDAFETSQDADDHDETADHGRGSVDLDELPIELVTLTDRYMPQQKTSSHGGRLLTMAT